MAHASSEPGSAATAELDSLLLAVAEDAKLVQRLLGIPLSQILGHLDEEGFSDSFVWEAIQADPSIDFDHYRALLAHIPESAILALSPREIQADHPELAHDLLETIGQHLLALADDGGLLQTAGGTKFGSWGGSGTSMWRTNSSRTKRQRVEARGSDTSIGVAAAITVGVVGYRKGWWGNRDGSAKQSEPLKQELEKKPGDSRPVVATRPKAENPLLKVESNASAQKSLSFKAKAGLIQEDCGGDGDCLYRSLARGLQDIRPGIKHQELRALGLDYMKKNPSAFDPKSFNLASGESRFETMQAYINAHSAAGHWGDQQNVDALSKALGVNIGVKPKEGNIQYSFADIEKAPTIYVQHEYGHYTLLKPDPAQPELFERFKNEDILRDCRENPFPGVDNPEAMRDAIAQGADLQTAYDLFAPDSKEAFLMEAETKARIVANGGLDNVDVRRIQHRASRRMSEALDGSGASQFDSGLDQPLNAADGVERRTSRVVSADLAKAELDAMSDLHQGSKDVVDSVDRDGNDLIDKEMSGLEDI